MNSVRRSLSPSLVILVTVLVGYLIISPLQAFSTGVFSSSQCIGWRSTSTCTYALFQDEDCEDLCEAFGEDLTSTVSLNKVESDTASTNEGAKTSDNNYTPPKPSRRSRALWWAEDSLETCKDCDGTGEQTCRFCGGTGFMSAIGGDTDALFLEGIGKACPVCNDGVETCQTCAGTGFVWVPSWSRDRNRTSSLHP